MKNWTAILLTLILLGFPALSRGRAWTVMVYMAADNDLAWQSDVDLNEMEAVGSTPEVAVVVQQDLPGAGGRRYLIQHSGRILLDSLGTIDMADPTVLTQFGTWGASRFPAERYALILWDHGNGWSASGPRRDASRTFSFGSDWSSGDVMGVADGELRTALEGIQRGLGKPIDLLAFDGCTLQEAEVALEVGGSAKVMVGSQDLVPMDGYPYDRFLDSLAAHPTADETTAARELINSYISFYQGSGLVVSNSALLLSQSPELASSSKALLQAFLEAPNDSGILSARDTALTIFSGGGEVDLGDFLRLAENLSQGAVKEKSRAFRDALSRCVTMSRALGTDSSRHSGLSIWFPKTVGEFADRILDYSGLRWVPLSDWDEMAYASYRLPGSVRPTAPTLLPAIPDGHNSYLLSWRAAYAPARINGYEIRELTGRTPGWKDGAEDSSSRWALNGLIPSEGDAHSGRRSYYVFRDSAFMTLKAPIQVNPIAWLTLWAKRPYGQKIVAEISSDSMFTSISGVDSLTLGAKTWEAAGFSLPQGSYYLRLRVTKTGVYLDDLSLETFESSDPTLTGGRDTVYAVKNKPKGTHYYQLRAQDRQGVWGLYGPVAEVDVRDLAPAYVYPNPFRTDVRFVIDGEASGAKLRIYTVAGDLVRTLEGFTRQSDGTFVCVWDGKNAGGKEAAAGIYLYLLAKQGGVERGVLAKVK